MHRVLALLRARWKAEAAGGAPIAPLLTHAALSALLCGLVRDELDTWGYALCALSFSAALAAIPLLGELGAVLRRDPAEAWVEAQPITRRDVAWARAIHVLALLFALAAASLLPAALMLHGGLATRAALFGIGFAQVTCLAAVLLFAQAWLGGRAESLLVALQTALVVGVLVGLVVGMRQIGLLREWTKLGVPLPPAVAWLPPAWFAAALHEQAGAPWRGFPLAAALLALAVLAFAPAATPLPARATGGLLDRMLSPLRSLASRSWVEPAERGAFELVATGLPREREFALRVYPLFGLPLAFLLLGGTGADANRNEAFASLLLFSVGVYLPVLLAQVPCSESHAARWLLDGAPVAPTAIENGACKALVVRFLVPLYVALFALVAATVSPLFALRIAPVAFLCSTLLLRKMYATCASERPLTIAPSELNAPFDWAGMLGGLAFGAAIAAAAAWKLLASPWVAAGTAAVLACGVWYAFRPAAESRRTA
jgi:hypothetical protein